MHAAGACLAPHCAARAGGVPSVQTRLPNRTNPHGLRLQAFKAAERERERLMDAAIEGARPLARGRHVGSGWTLLTAHGHSLQWVCRSSKAPETPLHPTSPPDYCQRKQAADAERAAAAVARQAAKDAARRAQVEAMERNYAQWHAKTEAALQADAKAAEDKAAAEAAARAARRREAAAAADAVNRGQLARKAADTAAAREADAAFRTAWGQRLAGLRADEAAEAAAARTAAVKVEEFQRWQAGRRAAVRAAAKRADVQDALLATAAVDDAEAAFRDYAAGVRAEAGARGLATRPLDRVLAAKPNALTASL